MLTGGGAAAFPAGAGGGGTTNLAPPHLARRFRQLEVEIPESPSGLTAAASADQRVVLVRRRCSTSDRIPSVTDTSTVRGVRGVRGSTPSGSVRGSLVAYVAGFLHKVHLFHVFF